MSPQHPTITTTTTTTTYTPQAETHPQIVGTPPLPSNPNPPLTPPNSTKPPSNPPQKTPQIQTNLLNAKRAWGEHSPQYAACRQAAEASLPLARAGGARPTGGGLEVEGVVGGMGRLAVGDGGGGGGADSYGGFERL